MSQAAARAPAIWMILVTGFLDMLAMGLVMPVLLGLIEGPTGSLAAAGLWTGITGPVFFGWVYAVSAGWMPGLSFVIGAGILAVAAGFAGVGRRQELAPQR